MSFLGININKQAFEYINYSFIGRLGGALQPYTNELAKATAGTPKIVTPPATTQADVTAVDVKYPPPPGGEGHHTPLTEDQVKELFQTKLPDGTEGPMLHADKTGEITQDQLKEITRVANMPAAERAQFFKGQEAIVTQNQAIRDGITEVSKELDKQTNSLMGAFGDGLTGESKSKRERQNVEELFWKREQSRIKKDAI